MPTSSPTIAEIWASLPALPWGLREPATEQSIRAAEKQLGHDLPADVVASYRIHDGQDDTAEPLCDPWQLLPLEDVLVQAKLQRELLESGEFSGRPVQAGPGVRAAWWDAAWIPIAATGAGDFYAVDLNPAEGGTRGQIIEVSHESAPRTVVASSFRDWLQETAGGQAAAEQVSSASAPTGCVPSFDQLLAIYGKSLTDPKAKSFLDSQPLEAGALEEGERDLECKPFGYLISTRRSKISGVEIYYGQQKLGYSPFTGALPAGIAVQNSREQVESKLGPAKEAFGFKIADPHPQGFIVYKINGASVAISWRKSQAGIYMIQIGR